MASTVLDFGGWKSFTNQDLGRSAAYLLVETLIGLVSGYAFWFIMSRFSTPQVIGTSSAVISFTTIFVNVATIGIPIGIERYLGRSFSEKRLGDAKHYVGVSTLLVSIGLISTSGVLLILRDQIQQIFNVDSKLMLIAIVLLCSTSIYNLFRSVLIAALKTRTLPIIATASAGLRIGTGLLFILIGLGAFGVTIGYSLASILGAVLFVAVVTIRFRGFGKSQVSFVHTFKDIISASTANWIPAMIATAGAQLGTIVVFASNGAGAAGVYFIAYSIVAAIAAVASVLFTIAFPVLSGMDDGRKSFVWRITKMSAIIAIPFSASAFFYAKEILQLFGTGYDQGSLLLQIMILAILPGQIASGVSTLSYSYGKYRQVLAINITGNVVRILLFFILTPIFGTTGAAVSYTLSTIASLVVSISISTSIGLRIIWRTLVLTFAVPFGLAFLQSYFEIHLIIAAVVTILISFLIFMRMRIITKMDLQDSVGVLPIAVARPTLNVLNKIAKKLDPSY